MFQIKGKILTFLTLMKILEQTFNQLSLQHDKDNILHAILQLKNFQMLMFTLVCHVVHKINSRSCMTTGQN